MKRFSRSGIFSAAVSLVALLAAGLTGEAVAASLAWAKTFNGAASSDDEGYGVAAASDGSIYVAGYTTNASQYDNLLLRKYSPSGGAIWSRSWNGSANGHDGATGVALGPDNGVYAAGYTDVAGQSRDLVLRKYSPSGGLLWHRTYNGPGNLAETANAVAVAVGGSVYVAGYTETAAEGDNLLLVKYSPSGARTWVRTYNSPGSGRERANGVAVAPDGSVYVVGYTYVSGQPIDLLLRKYSAAGALIWSKTYHNGPAKSAEGRAVAVDRHGAVYVTGSTETATEPANLVLRKYAASGAVLWTRIYNAPQVGGDGGAGLAVAEDGSVNATGFTRVSGGYNVLLVHYSSAGALLGKRVYAGPPGGDDRGAGVAAGEGSRVYVAGHTEAAGQGYNLLLLKYQ